MIKRIYTDGAAKKAIRAGRLWTVFKIWGHRKELAEGFPLTTNKINGAFGGNPKRSQELKSTEFPSSDLFPDSKYVVDSVGDRLAWGWQKKKGLRIKRS